MLINKYQPIYQSVVCFVKKIKVEKKKQEKKSRKKRRKKKEEKKKKKKKKKKRENPMKTVEYIKDIDEYINIFSWQKDSKKQSFKEHVLAKTVEKKKSVSNEDSLIYLYM